MNKKLMNLVKEAVNKKAENNKFHYILYTLKDLVDLTRRIEESVSLARIK